jgi:hypothetical protein
MCSSSNSNNHLSHKLTMEIINQQALTLHHRRSVRIGNFRRKLCRPLVKITTKNPCCWVRTKSISKCRSAKTLCNNNGELTSQRNENDNLNMYFFESNENEI